ncbi:MAG: hypothetical protein M0Z65_14510 [Firmicutes bacterium]|uniref:Uncharacterized protein n=1 Tax=Melghirimyces thermohalophilus TaxID=1236220 RepID=A0A1G6HLD1_9BACL|nr:hypothetical protein [Melghirimyces thermohalophilus]MDA8354360.1 hypothetical protein [Bacillota bacterium]SDB95060.1 hypothetical protein SAMN04488112_10161 [Melghirimyces thermohalophilus]
MGFKKIRGVTFDMADPQDRMLLEQVERETRDFSQLVKNLLARWLDPAMQSKEEGADDRQEAIRNSGLPFG